MKKSIILSSIVLVASVSVISTSFAASNNGFLNGKPFEYLNNKVDLNTLTIAELEAVTAQLALDIEQSNQNIADLELNVVTNTAAIIDIQDQINLFETSLSATQDDVAALFADLGALEAQHISDMERLLGLISDQRTEIARLRSQVQAAIVQLAQQIAEVQAELDVNGGDIDALLVISASTTADILAMNAVLDDHESRLVAAESSIGVLVGNIADIQVQLGNIEFRLSGAETNIDILQALHATSFAGVRQNIPQSSLTGWVECFSEGFGSSGTPIADVTLACDKAKIMLACRITGSPTLKVAAYADRADVLFDVGSAVSTTHEANGVNWYYSDSFSWGFAPAGQAVSRSSCDVDNQSSNDRICNHTRNGSLDGGWRCGDAVRLNDNNSYERVFLTAD